MQNAQEAPRQPEFDAGPFVKLYKDSLAAWQKSIEAAMEASKAPTAQGGETANPAANFDKAFAQAQATSEPVMRHAIELQREVVRFMARRWEQYLDLASALSRCRTSAEAAEVQKAYFAKMFSDYSSESKQVMQDYQRLVAEWMSAAPKPVIPL